MLSAFRIFLNRRFFAVVVYVALALVLFILLEPRPRFQLTDEERSSAIYLHAGRLLVHHVDPNNAVRQERRDECRLPDTHARSGDRQHRPRIGVHQRLNAEDHGQPRFRTGGGE